MINNKKFDISLHPEFDYVDMKKYFDDLCKQKYVKKNTFSIIYHQMFNLIGSHLDIVTFHKTINISYGHIILLSYLMGFVKEQSGSETFWGGNATLASDIGVSTRTIQRWLRDLEDVGFVKTIIERNTDRYIYINFGQIITEINKAVGIEINNVKLTQACRLVVETFIHYNYLERDKQRYYIDYLVKQCNIQYCIKNEINIRYLFSLMIEKLDLNWENFEGYYKAVNHHYIEKIANAN